MQWTDWIGLKVFLRLNSGLVYTGKVIDVDESSSPLVFITIIDKFDKRVTFVQSEIIKIEEER